MINTYQTSLPPPPVPPRIGRDHPAFGTGLVRAPASGHSKPLLRFLVGVVVLHLLLSFGGFVYLYHTGNKAPSAEGRKELQRTGDDFQSHRPMARMEVLQPVGTEQSKYLKWNIAHSIMRDINYYMSTWLTVKQSGDYYVYSRVTFSKWHPRNLLTSRVKLRKSPVGEEKTLMMAYCGLGDHLGLCTASQGEVVRLEEGDQVCVWVDDPSLVDYEARATTLGLYKMDDV